MMPSTRASAPPPAARRSTGSGRLGAYSSDLLLMLFGPAAVLLLPVLAVAGLRLMRGETAGRLGRSLLVAAIGILLAGIALAMVRGTAVSGLPAGWGGALGLAGAHGIDAGIDLIGDPAIEGPLRMALMALLAVGGLLLAWFALGLREEEKGWIAGLFRRDSDRPVRPPRKTVEEREARDSAAAPPRAAPGRRRRRAGQAGRTGLGAQGRPCQAPAVAGQPGARRQLRPALGRPAHPAAAARQGPARQGRAGAQRPPARIGARGFLGQGRDRRGPPGPGRHHVRAGAGERHQGEPGHPARRRHRPQHVGACRRASRPSPGRSVIGIELPNAKREMVALSELIGSPAFEDQVWPCR